MRVLLLEDHASLAEAIATHLKAKGLTVDIASTIREAQSALRAAPFDALLLDLSLPDGDGLDLLNRIRQQGSAVPVIIMTARDQITERIQGLEAGADDYVVKPFDLNELLARLQAVMRRYAQTPAPVARVGKFEIDRVGQRVLKGGVDVQLSAKEWALFEKLASMPNAIVSKEQLLESMYGFSEEIFTNTLEVYVNRLRKKLGREAIETVHGQGYRFAPGP